MNRPLLLLCAMLSVIATDAVCAAEVSAPSTAELSAALVGGVVVAPSGKTVALPGVLKQRAAGMAWSEIAQRYGTTMRAFNHGAAAPRATMAADSGRAR